MFTLFLNFLASGSLTKSPLALPPSQVDEDYADSDGLNEWGYQLGSSVTSEELSLFGRFYEVVLVEPSMRLNVLASVSTMGAKELQREVRDE